VICKINSLISQFKEVRYLDIQLCEAKYYRPADRLIFPANFDFDKETYFAIAHELGHKQNSKWLLFLFDLVPIKLFQIFLEIDAHARALFITKDLEYIRFSVRFLFSYF